MSTSATARDDQHHRGLSAHQRARLDALVAASPGTPGLVVLSPLTGQPLGPVPQLTAADVGAVFAQARAAQGPWASMPARQRAQVLLRLHDLVLDEREQLCDLVQMESGKTHSDALEEVLDVAVNCRYLGRAAPELLRPIRERGAIPVLTSTRVVRHPIGVVGVVAAWNYPLVLAATDALAALAAGNAVVVKPDSQGAHSAAAVVDLAHRAGVPDGVLRLVTGTGPEVGAALVGHADAICFTGSTATGRLVAAQAASRLIPASLELGGKNALVVRADADIGLAVSVAVRGSFASAGQLCVSFERIVVHAARYEAFRQRFVAAVSALSLGATIGGSAEVGTLVSAAQLARVMAHVDGARAAGATVCCGGRARADIAPWCYEPTVLEGVEPTMAVWGEETFGPVVSLYPARDDEEMVAMVNGLDYGLHASVIGRDRSGAAALGERLRVGTVSVNEAYQAAWGSTSAPMGGRGASGLGRRHGVEGLLRFTEPQTIAVQRFVGMAGPRWMPRRMWDRTLVGGLRVLRRSHRP